MTVYYSAVFGRPFGARKALGYRFTWCAWWAEPCFAPFTPPDAFGGACTREDVPGLVELHAARLGPSRGPLKQLPAMWAQEFRHVQREGTDDRARRHAQAQAEFEACRRETRERYAADPAGFEAEWARARDALRAICDGLGAKPQWAVLLDLSWPSFTADDVTRSFRALAFAAHPDRGGTHEAMVALTVARREALTHLDRQSATQEGV